MTQTALLARTNWNLDGKNMRELMRSVESGDDASGDLAYSFEFAKSSHAVHGTWIDLLNHHLEKRGRWYSADVGFTDPSPRFIGPPSALLADLLFGFARHFGLDSSGVLRELLHFFYWFFRAFDDAWEDKLEEMGFVPSL